MKRKRLTIAVISVSIWMLGAVSTSAQSLSPLIVNYFANNGVSGAPDATVRVTNFGSINGNLCAMIYVFDNDQQMSECCGCVTTPDGLRTLSVGKDLTSNPLTGVVSKTGDIKILTAAVNGLCDPTLMNGQFAILPGLRAWATHIQNKVGTAYPITESPFTDAGLSDGELGSLQNDCYFIERLGSGHGLCTCGSGD